MVPLLILMATPQPIWIAVRMRACVTVKNACCHSCHCCCYYCWRRCCCLLLSSLNCALWQIKFSNDRFTSTQTLLVNPFTFTYIQNSCLCVCVRVCVGCYKWPLTVPHTACQFVICWPIYWSFRWNGMERKGCATNTTTASQFAHSWPFAYATDAPTHTHTHRYAYFNERHGYKNYKGNKAHKKPKSYILVFPTPKRRVLPSPPRDFHCTPFAYGPLCMETNVFIDELTI